MTARFSPQVDEPVDSLFRPWSDGSAGRRPNLDPGFVESVAKLTGLSFVSDGRGDLNKTFGPEDILAYIYSVFHSPKFRTRFGSLLKLDFPRVPWPNSVSAFVSLSKYGHKLVDLHLLRVPDSGCPETKYLGRRAPTVERVLWSDGIVWLDTAQTSGFEGVQESVWNFRVGSYQVCEKWLKDRKGRKLSKSDIVHYGKIVNALSETIGIMNDIDKAIDECLISVESPLQNSR